MENKFYVINNSACIISGSSVECEGLDRADINLPGKQLQLLQDAVKWCT
jgi:hypothetical protein